MQLPIKPEDTDAALVATFRNHADENKAKSRQEGRPIYDDREVCVIRFPGSNETRFYPSTEISHWITDPYTGDERPITYAERFPRQYEQWKANAQQTKSGTPLDYARFLTEARRAEMRALNIYTLEQLAEVDGQPLKNLGPFGRDLKNKAIEYLAELKLGAPNREMMAELEQIKARNALLEEDVKAMRDRADSEGEFEGMSIDQLRDFVTANTGHVPQGQLSRKTLVRMALDARPEKAA